MKAEQAQTPVGDLHWFEPPRHGDCADLLRGNRLVSRQNCLNQATVGRAVITSKGGCAFTANSARWLSSLNFAGGRRAHPMKTTLITALLCAASMLLPCAHAQQSEADQQIRNHWA